MSWRCSRRTSSTRVSELNRDRGAAVQHRVRNADARRRRQLEIQRDLCDARAGRAAGGVHQCRRLAVEPRATRTREIAVRLALGAGRFRLVRLLLTESLILASLGGLAGVAIGYGGFKFLRTFRIPADLPVTIPFRWTRRVLLASLALSILSALFCGLAPALQSTRTDLVNGLKSADVDVPGTPQTAVGTQCAGGGAGAHVADAADGLVSDGRGSSTASRGAPVSRKIIC